MLPGPDLARKCEVRPLLLCGFCDPRPAIQGPSAIPPHIDDAARCLRPLDCIERRLRNAACGLAFRQYSSEMNKAWRISGPARRGLLWQTPASGEQGAGPLYLTKRQHPRSAPTAYGSRAAFGCCGGGRIGFQPISLHFWFVPLSLFPIPCAQVNASCVVMHWSVIYAGNGSRAIRARGRPRATLTGSTATKGRGSALAPLYAPSFAAAPASVKETGFCGRKAASAAEPRRRNGRQRLSSCGPRHAPRLRSCAWLRSSCGNH